MKKGIITAVITIVAFLLILSFASSVVVTQENEYTLIRQFGKVDRVIDEAGLSFKIPFMESVFWGVNISIIILIYFLNYIL